MGGSVIAVFNIDLFGNAGVTKVLNPFNAMDVYGIYVQKT